MTEELVSANAFHWALIAVTGGVAGLWAIYDLRNLLKLRGADFADPLIRDRRFGYLIGIVIGIGGVIGCVGYHAQFVS